MQIYTAILLASVAGLVGLALGYVLRILVAFGKKGSIELQIKQTLLDAKEEAESITQKAIEEASEREKTARQEIKEREEKLKSTEERLIKKEDLLDRRQADIDAEAERLKSEAEESATTNNRIKELETQRRTELARISSMTPEAAKDELLRLAEVENAEDISVRLHKLEEASSEKLERRAQTIIVNAIHRLGTSVAADVMSTAIAIPSDEVKGKIIGKEGRNIKAFERATGVEVIVDDTPGTITVSSFDPVRRAIAKKALEDLIADGRIQPAKIEKLVEDAKESINKTIKEKGEQAAYECGAFNLDPRIIAVLGRLHFRTSYGQNVLQHSIEVAHLAGMIAEEVGANPTTAKIGGLVHDIGKALDHEVTGTHVEIGRRLLQKFGVPEDVVKAMQAHHEEYPFETPESIIVQVADAISGSRPGARRDSVENYLKRLGDLEAIATSKKGVERAYALQAGREVRVFVRPEEVSDLEARKLARDIALSIEKELKYPGEIKVHIIRETRIVDFAR